MPNREKLRQMLVRLLEHDTGDSHVGLDENDLLRSELGLDSVNLMNLVMHLERRFHFRLTVRELERVVLVGDLLDLLQEKLAAGQRMAA